MTKEKKLMLLEISYDLISKVHSDICADPKIGRESKITDETMDILDSLIMLSKRIKRECTNEK